MSCLSEATLQSYFDGELGSARHEAARRHLANCAPCAAAARDVESEIEELSRAFDFVQPPDVPTEHLRANLRAAIARESAPAPITLPSPIPEKRTSRLAAFLARAFAAPRLSSSAYNFAALLAAAVIAGVAAWFALSPSNTPGPETAVVRKGNKPSAPRPPAATTATAAPSGEDAVDRADRSYARVPNDAPRLKFLKASDAGGSRPKPEVSAPKGGDRAVQLLPGEKSYLKAIISLKSELRARGELALQPEMRVEYERNLAVVDQAIAVSRVAAMSDSRDTDANAMLLSAYQSKVDLLSEAVNQTQLASAER